MNLRKGPWLEEEDEQLNVAVSVLGDRRWDALAKSSGLRRSGKSCRLRWMNYLRPNLKHGHITTEEEELIVELHEKWGNRWSKIARKLPGRTDNDIKNYWRSYLKRKGQAIEKGIQMQEQYSQSINDTASPCSINSLASECGTNTTSPSSTNEEFFLFTGDNNFGLMDDCSNNASEELLNLTRSPYEARLTEWVSNFFPGMNKETDFPNDGLSNFDDYHQEWISNDYNNISVWELPLWHEE